MVRWYIGVTFTFLMLLLFICGTIYFYKERSKIKRFLCAPVLIGFFLVIMGSLCNSIVVFFNDYKMPVLGEAYDKYHCDLTEESRYVFLADIFHLDLGGRILMYSIGDILMFGGLFMYVTYVLFCGGITIFKK